MELLRPKGNKLRENLQINTGLFLAAFAGGSFMQQQIVECAILKYS